MSEVREKKGLGAAVTNIMINRQLSDVIRAARCMHVAPFGFFFFKEGLICRQSNQVRYDDLGLCFLEESLDCSF
jgi:hypothetical protein